MFARRVSALVSVDAVPRSVSGPGLAAPRGLYRTSTADGQMLGPTAPRASRKHDEDPRRRRQRPLCSCGCVLHGPRQHERGVGMRIEQGRQVTVAGDPISHSLRQFDVQYWAKAWQSTL